MEVEIAHPLFGYTVSYRRILEVQARLLSRVLSGEIKEYPAFMQEVRIMSGRELLCGKLRHNGPKATAEEYIEP